MGVYYQFDETEARKRKAKFIPPRRPFKPENYSEEDWDRWCVCVYEKERERERVCAFAGILCVCMNDILCA